MIYHKLVQLDGTRSKKSLRISCWKKLEEFCPSFTDDVILKRLTKSPLDIEKWNPHMINGAPHGGDRSITFAGEQRPVPGWAQHRMPIQGLWQTGGTTHPGGSITGYPVEMLQKLSCLI